MERTDEKNFTKEFVRDEVEKIRKQAQSELLSTLRDEVVDEWEQEATFLENKNSQSPDTARWDEAKASTFRLCIKNVLNLLNKPGS